MSSEHESKEYGARARLFRVAINVKNRTYAKLYCDHDCCDNVTKLLSMFSLSIRDIFHRSMQLTL